VTVPGFMLIVIWEALLIVGVPLLVFQTPEPVPTVQRNCTWLPDWKFPPLTVSVRDTPSAGIEVGLMLLTVGADGIAAVTVKVDENPTSLLVLL